ncbi:hypothetical protein OSI78_17915, partial [Mycobacterium ulcerans]
MRGSAGATGSALAARAAEREADGGVGALAARAAVSGRPEAVATLAPVPAGPTSTAVEPGP